MAGQDHNHGLTVLLRRGMRAWFEAWSLCSEKSTAETSSPPPDARETVHPSLHPEIVLVLAGMALNRQRTMEVQ
jgi:hypothetical protein